MSPEELAVYTIIFVWSTVGIARLCQIRQEMRQAAKEHEAYLAFLKNEEAIEGEEWKG